MKSNAPSSVARKMMLASSTATTSSRSGLNDSPEGNWALKGPSPGKLVELRPTPEPPARGRLSELLACRTNAKRAISQSSLALSPIRPDRRIPHLAQTVRGGRTSSNRPAGRGHTRCEVLDNGSRDLAPLGTKPSSATSHKPWRRRRPSTSPDHCRSGGLSSGRARHPARS
jgi:hypothetical protein